MTLPDGPLRFERASAERWSSDVQIELVLGAPCRTFVRRPPSVASLLHDARTVADNTYLIEGDRRLTFADHERAVRSVAARLSGRGVGVGDRVMLFGANSVEWVTAFWAIQHLGAIVVLANGWWPAEELEHALRATSPMIVLADERRGDRLPTSSAMIALESLADAFGDGSDTAPGAHRVAEDDPAVILFTSGTTGLPKGATLSHRGIISTLQSLLVRTNRLPVPGEPVPPASVALLTLPLFHIGGLQQIVTPMVNGGTLVFSTGRFDPAAVVDLIDRERVRAWSTVPSMAGRVIQHLRQSGRGPMRGIRTVGLGGSPVGEQLRREVAEWFPDARRGLAVTWGLSEAGGVVTTGAGEPVRAHPGTVGQPLPTAEVRVAEADANGHGEILVRGPSVMLGYWGETGLDTGPIGADRWLHTGDVGWVDADGFVYITDRIKDIVIRGGENIATPRVEDVLSAHPDVAEVVAVGLPHEDLGEELGAIVRLHSGATASAGSLAAFATERLAYFEVPSRWRFVTEPFPQNDTGKIMKRTLQEAWQHDLERERP
jgi:long-chain acyl-CoA synthetase